MSKVIDLMGGIGQLSAMHDIVVIKPNMQWWNQGAPNIAAIEYTYFHDYGSTWRIPG